MTGRIGKLRFMLGHRPDMCGYPRGFWFAWVTRDETRYKPAKVRWKFGMSFYPVKPWVSFYA